MFPGSQEYVEKDEQIRNNTPVIKTQKSVTNPLAITPQMPNRFGIYELVP
jgi:hypothetical protein